VSPQDRSVALLFGDAGTATLVEKSSEAKPLTFVLGTDGAGGNNLIVPAGGFRHIGDDASRLPSERENGNIRSDQDLFMNGAEIFTFTLARVPPLIKKVLAESNRTIEEVDRFVFHQANKFMLDFLAKKMKLPSDKIPLALEKFGNTSSASIPLALSVSLSEKLRHGELKLVLSGFGVGYSWGAVSLDAGPMIMPELIFAP
jgi:3-oxoacyl-[acyl-carrier-protein] synthase-3